MRIAWVSILKWMNGPSSEISLAVRPSRTIKTDKLLASKKNKTAGYRTVKGKAAGNSMRGELPLAFEM